MKRLLALFFALLLSLSLCACDLSDIINPPTNPTDGVLYYVEFEIISTNPTTTTVPTEPSVPNLTDDVRQQLKDFAKLFEWGDDVVEVIMATVPDVVMLSRVESTDDNTHFIIIMSDGIEYCLDLGSNREALRIYYNTGDNSVTERDFIFNIG